MHGANMKIVTALFLVSLFMYLASRMKTISMQGYRS